MGAESVPPADLEARIAARTAAIFAAGLFDEARALLAAGVTPAHPAYRTIGYEEAFAVVRGELSVEAAVAAAIRSTRQFARRQRTWFRAERGAGWVRVPAGEPPEETAARILAGFG